MLHLLRKIRKSLINTESGSKYIFYAIGEIVLVVIGILIALQINNWNELRSKKSEITNIYISITDEMQSDIDKLDQILPDFEWKTNVLERIIKNEFSEDNWIENDSLFRSFFSFYDFDIGKERFQLLKTKIAINDSTRVLNNRIADFYKKHSTDITVRTHEANMSYHRNIEYWEENDDWFSKAIVDVDYSILAKHATSNEIFRNKLTWYRIMLSRLAYSLRSYQEESKQLIDEIKYQIETLN